MTGYQEWNSSLTRRKGLKPGGQLVTRTPLAPGKPWPRKAPMGRGSVTILGSNVVPLERPAPRAAAKPKRRKPPAPELTFSPEAEALIFQACGSRCFLACWTDPPCWGLLAAHHRQLKGMGGSKRASVHTPSMGVVLCQAHHVQWAHEHPIEAREYGLIIPRNQITLPSTQLRLSPDRGRTWRWLTDDGHMLTEPPPAPVNVA